jgi:hypothetical protein
MLTLDLPAFFGIMIRPACQKIPIRDLPEFVDSFFVISDFIVIRMYTGCNEDMEVFKAFLVNTLSTRFKWTLTCSSDSLTLSTNQVNVPVPTMYTLGARLCRVSFFGMKMFIPSAELVIDNFICRYRDYMRATVSTGRNLFKYGARYSTDAVLLFRFNKEQHRARRFRVGMLHEMCNEECYGSVECRPLFDLRLSKVKVYQKLIHEIL